jgi:hypothetical protein
MATQRPLRERSTSWAALYAIWALLFLLLVFHLGGPGLALGDFAEGYARHRAFLKTSLWEHGAMPFWNPYNFSGHPFVGDLLLAPFYPTMALYLLLPQGAALFLDLAVHLVLGSLGARAWCRRLGIGWLGAGVAGLLYLSTPAWVGHTWAGHLQHVQALAWTPWMLWTAETWLRGEARRRWLPGVLVVGALVGSGGVPVAWMSLLFLPLYLGVRWLALRRAADPAPAALWRVMLGAGVQAVLGLVLAAPHWLPAALYTRHCGRIEMAAHVVASDALTPAGLLAAVLPELLPRVSTVDYQAFEWYGYPGLVMLAFAALALLVTGVRRWLPLLILCLLALVMAVGPTLGITSLLTTLIPGYGQLRCHCRELYLTLLFLLPLAGAGAELLWNEVRGQDESKRLRWGLVALAVLLAVALPLRLWAAGAAPSPWVGLILAALLGALAWRPHPWQLGLLLLLHAADVSSAGRALARHADVERWSFTSRPGVDEILLADDGWYRFWGSEEVVNPNHGVILQRRSILGYENQFPARYARYIARVAQLPSSLATTHLSPGLIDLMEDPFPFEILGLRYGFRTTCEREPPPAGATGQGPPPGAGPGGPPGEGPLRDLPLAAQGSPDAHREQACEHWEVVENPDPFPRAVLVSDLQWIEDPEQALERVVDPGFDPRRQAVVEAQPAWPAATGPAADATRVISVEDQGPNRIVVELEAAEQVLLVLSEQYLPGWSARSEAGPLPVQRADYLLRAVPVPPGRHRVELSYWPPGLGVGLLLGLLALLGAALPLTPIPSPRGEGLGVRGSRR